MKNFLNRFRKDDSGATAIEYGLIAGIMAVAIITAFGLFSSGLSARFNEIITAMG